jgi:hypothetical protein
MIYEGGYLNNKFQDYYIEEDKSIEFSSDFLESINYIQQVPLKINKKYLDWLLKENIIILLKEYSTLDINIIENFVKGDVYQIPIDKFNILNEIGTTLYLALTFSKFKKIYFPVFMDFRGRHYCNSYPLQYYTNKIMKGLFSFVEKEDLKKKEKINLEKFLKKNSGNDKLFDLNKEKKNYYSEKHFFNFRSIQVDPSNAFIGLDASASAFQIQGLLLRDELMLELTNVFPNEVKQDIYTFVMNALYEEIRNNILLETI